jgi:phytoene dehydrogenase-like protein
MRWDDGYSTDDTDELLAQKMGFNAVYVHQHRESHPATSPAIEDGTAETSCIVTDDWLFSISATACKPLSGGHASKGCVCAGQLTAADTTTSPAGSQSCFDQTVESYTLELCDIATAPAANA